MLTKFIFAVASLAPFVAAQIPLQAPVNTPVLIQTFLVNPRFAPCLRVPYNGDGAPVTIRDCGTRNTTDIKWTVVAGGAPEFPFPAPGPVTQIRILGNKCLDVPNGNNADGVALQIWTCANGNPNQLWRVNAEGTISWAGHNKCVDLRDAKLTDGSVVQTWTCSPNNVNQDWNAVPPAA